MYPARVSDLENLPDMRDAAAGRPPAAMNHDDGRAAGGALLHVRIEREIAGIGDVPLDARNDVVAIGIANLKRRTRLRGSRRCHEQKRDERDAGAHQ